MKGLVVGLHSSVLHRLPHLPRLFDIQSLPSTRLERREEYPFPDRKEEIILSELIIQDTFTSPLPPLFKILKCHTIFTCFIFFLKRSEEYPLPLLRKEKKSKYPSLHLQSLSFSSLYASLVIFRIRTSHVNGASCPVAGGSGVGARDRWLRGGGSGKVSKLIKWIPVARVL